MLPVGKGSRRSLVFRWKLSQEGKDAVCADDEIAAASKVRKLEDRFRELERLFGRKTMEVESSRRSTSSRKKRHCCRTRRFREIPVEDGWQHPRCSGSNFSGAPSAVKTYDNPASTSVKWPYR
jgi:hypothetical protein